MKLPERINKCPLTRECAAKVLFKDDEGNLYRFDYRTHEFHPHICSVVGASTLPVIVYAAAWYNKRTGRTRYQGPERMRKSVEKPPKDDKYRKRGSDKNEDWELKQVYVCEMDWKPVED